MVRVGLGVANTTPLLCYYFVLLAKQSKRMMCVLAGGGNLRHASWGA